MNDSLKQRAALAALAEVQADMIVGLGTGSTMNYFIRGLGERVREGLSVSTVATSLQSAALAEKEGIPVRTFREHKVLDLTVDGADEVSPGLDLVKGVEVTGVLKATDSLAITAPQIPSMWQFSVARMAPEGTEVELEDFLIQFDNAPLQEKLQVARNDTESVRKKLDQAISNASMSKEDQGLVVAEDLVEVWRRGRRRLDPTPGTMRPALRCRQGTFFSTIS